MWWIADHYDGLGAEKKECFLEVWTTLGWLAGENGPPGSRSRHPGIASRSRNVRSDLLSPCGQVRAAVHFCRAALAPAICAFQ